jgi:hypothetical protein
MRASPSCFLSHAKWETEGIYIYIQTYEERWTDRVHGMGEGRWQESIKTLDEK